MNLASKAPMKDFPVPKQKHERDVESKQARVVTWRALNKANSLREASDEGRGLGRIQPDGLLSVNEGRNVGHGVVSDGRNNFLQRRGKLQRWGYGGYTGIPHKKLITKRK